MAHASELRLGTRGSQLALWQARAVAARIAEHGGPPCRIVVIKTSGDVLADRPLSEAGGKRLFVKEIEDALLRNDVDLAVHSSKDMPAALPDGLAIAGVLPREDPLDDVVLPVNVRPKPDATVDDLIALLGPAPNVDPQAQGPAFLAVVRENPFPPGVAVVAWLASDESQMVTGQVIRAVAERIILMDGWADGATINNGGTRWDATKLGLQFATDIFKTRAPGLRY